MADKDEGKLNRSVRVDEGTASSRQPHFGHVCLMANKAIAHRRRGRSVCSLQLSNLLGHPSEICLVYHPFDISRLTYLRAELAKVRLERITLAREIQTPAIPMDRKLVAKRRYTAAGAEMKNVVRELEAFICAVKQAQAASGTS